VGPIKSRYRHDQLQEVILLDTNVLSALMQARPDPVIVDWLDSQAPESIWATAVTVLEIRRIRRRGS
jgi:predicted nucleic acid-binding protein